MRTASISCLIVFITTSIAAAGTPQTQSAAKGSKTTLTAANGQNVQQNAVFRCAYLGQRGSFHLIDSTGTAAYNLGTGQYIADLSFAGQDASYYLYRPTSNGDQNTTMWAFAKQPDCGKYWVWRYDRGRWKQYEATEAWGIGLGGIFGGSSSGDAVQQLQLEVIDLKKRVGKLEQAARN